MLSGGNSVRRRYHASCSVNFFTMRFLKERKRFMELLVNFLFHCSSFFSLRTRSLIVYHLDFLPGHTSHLSFIKSAQIQSWQKSSPLSLIHIFIEASWQKETRRKVLYISIWKLKFRGISRRNPTSHQRFLLLYEK